MLAATLIFFMNTILVFLFICANLWQFIVVPILGGIWFYTLIPFFLLNNSMWSLIHEAIHSNLFKDNFKNKYIGRIMSCLFGSSFTFLSAAHLTHHALNRTEHERLEIVPRNKNIWIARLEYYFFLCGGLYLAEILVPIAFIAPLQKLKGKGFFGMIIARINKNNIKVFIESLAAIAFLLISAWLYKDNLIIFFSILFCRAFFISSLDYIYHYGNNINDVNASYNLKLPNILSGLILHFNYHHNHHESPKVSWEKLPEFNINCDKDYFRAALEVWKGPRYE